MRVIDNGKATFVLRDDLKATGHATELLERAEYGIDLLTRGNREACCDECILDLIAAEQGESQGDIAPFGMDRNALSEAVARNLDKLQRIAAESSRDEADAASPDGIDDADGLGTIGIYDGSTVDRQKLRKESQLSREIGIERRMIIEVVAPEVRVRRRGNTHTVETMLIKTVR